jgi:hypothetical protein
MARNAATITVLTENFVPKHPPVGEKNSTHDQPESESGAYPLFLSRNFSYGKASSFNLGE